MSSLWKRIAIVMFGLMVADKAFAQSTTGNIFGRVVDEVSGKPVSGVTVIASGPQGDQAGLTEADGTYQLAVLPVGEYAVQFFAPDSTTPVNVPNVVVSAGQRVRVDGKVNGAMTPSETVVVTRRAPSADFGTARTGITFNAETLQSVPLERNAGDVLSLAPGAFVEGNTGTVSIAGATGLENSYVVDGLNVTGIEYGSMQGRVPNSRGGTNLVLDFLEEIAINTGGYAAEYGGAMGGVVNMVTKSGTNRWKGTVFGMYTPSAFYGSPKADLRVSSALTGRSDFNSDLNFGFEVGGPLIKNKLFLWAGFAPRLESSTFQRQVQGLVDANGDGMADVDAAGNPTRKLLQSKGYDEYRNSYQMGTKLTYLPVDNTRLNLSLFTSPTHSQSMYPQNAAISLAAQNPYSGQSEFMRNNTDVILSSTTQLMDRKWRIDATLGFHHETFKRDSPYRDLNNRNSLEYYGTSLSNFENVPGCAPVTVGGNTFDPCPVDAYHTGGYGLIEQSTGNRTMGELKSTHLLNLFGRHELKYGIRGENNELNLKRRYSGPVGNQAAIQDYGAGGIAAYSFFTLPQGKYPFEFASDASPLAGSPYYQDGLDATVKNNTFAVFLQDGYSPTSNLSLNVGLRYERQKLFDSKNEPFASMDNVGLRAGAIYDPTSEGRAKLYTHYGRFFETVPLNMSARYFGGEGVLVRQFDPATCTTPSSQWSGSGGEFNSCTSAGTFAANNGKNYPVQPNIKGQYHDEIVAGGQWEPWDDFLFGVNFTHRWLRNVIEDGTAVDGTFVLANPGNIPQDALDKADADAMKKQAELDAATLAMDKAAIDRLQNEVSNLQSRSANLKGLAAAPKPTRRYTAMTLSLAKRLSKQFMVNAQYTYARLTGNHNGLYDADVSYAAPNGNTQYDLPEMYLNKNGPLANDRPHSLRVTGYYEQNVGPGRLTFGVVASAYSGVPRNYISNLNYGYQTFLLPRGSAGRTPTVTQFDTKLSYRQAIGDSMTMEVFFDIFNLINSRTALLTDDNYTFDQAAPIVGGTKADLAVAKSLQGQPLNVNPNFGNGRVFQAPRYGRMGLRLTF
ncbi:MAG: TonB-dependent receptor [Deltaproteobacteria bacterium]|nr:TonB-dependent receptor [Deltaproteobacteria bacterium]